MSGLGDGGLGLGDGEGTGGDGAGAGTVTVSVMVGRIGSLVVVMRIVDWVGEPVPALVGVSSVPSPVSEYAGMLGSSSIPPDSMDPRLLLVTKRQLPSCSSLSCSSSSSSWKGGVSLCHNID